MIFLNKEKNKSDLFKKQMNVMLWLDVIDNGNRIVLSKTKYNGWWNTTKCRKIEFVTRERERENIQEDPREREEYNWHSTLKMIPIVSI
jgi:hypothetical protein